MALGATLGASNAMLDEAMQREDLSTWAAAALRAKVPAASQPLHRAELPPQVRISPASEATVTLPAVTSTGCPELDAFFDRVVAGFVYTGDGRASGPAFELVSSAPDVEGVASFEWTPPDPAEDPKSMKAVFVDPPVFKTREEFERDAAGMSKKDLQAFLEKYDGISTSPVSGRQRQKNSLMESYAIVKLELQKAEIKHLSANNESSTMKSKRGRRQRNVIELEPQRESLLFPPSDDESHGSVILIDPGKDVEAVSELTKKKSRKAKKPQTNDKSGAEGAVQGVVKTDVSKVSKKKQDLIHLAPTEKGTAIAVAGISPTMRPEPVRKKGTQGMKDKSNTSQVSEKVRQQKQHSPEPVEPRSNITARLAKDASDKLGTSAPTPVNVSKEVSAVRASNDGELKKRKKKKSRKPRSRRADEVDEDDLLLSAATAAASNANEFSQILTSARGRISLALVSVGLLVGLGAYLSS